MLNLEDVLKALDDAHELRERERIYKEERAKLQPIIFKDPGPKRITARGTGPNCIKVSIENDQEVFASIELDEMDVKKLIKSLVMQL